MPSAWGGQTDVKFLITIIEQTGAKASWESVSKAMDGVFTAEACRQHYAKLKKTVLEEAPTAANGDAVASPATPTPRKRKAREPKTPGETPTKRPRKNAKKAAAEVKT